MKKLIFSLSLISMLASPLAKAECSFTQFSNYSETRCGLADWNDEDQQEAMRDFIDQVRQLTDESNLPPKGAKLADAALMQMRNNVSTLIDKLNQEAQNHRRGRGIRTSDLMPNGFFGVVGGNSSLGAVLSGTLSVMVSIAAVPTRVSRIDDYTKKETRHTEWSVEVGGLGMAGAGIGAGGSAAGIRYGAGLIFGDITKASDVIEAGFSLGFDADAEVIQGIGVSGIWAKNKSTSLDNFVVFAHGDTGASVRLEAHGDAVYLMSKDQVKALNPLRLIESSSPAPAPTVTVPTPATSPAPVASTAPVTPTVPKPLTVDGKMSLSERIKKAKTDFDALKSDVVPTK